LGLFGALYPAYIYLCPTLRLQSCGRPRMTRGQDGSLLLILYDSFIHDSTPVYPDAPQSRPASFWWVVRTIAHKSLLVCFFCNQLAFTRSQQLAIFERMTDPVRSKQ